MATVSCLVSLTFQRDSSTLNFLEEAIMFMFGPVGPGELVLIVVIVIIIFGAKRLPDLGKSLGEGIKNFKKSITGSEEESKKNEKEDSKPDSKD